MRVNYAIVFVSDMESSIEFYRDIIGLPLKFQSPHWTEFDTSGATLALHVTQSTVDDDPPTEQAGMCRTGFRVGNLDEFHARLIAHNVRCLQPPTETFGVRIAQYRDPDGMVFSASEARELE